METISSRKNPVITAFRRLADERAYRRETGAFLGQGHKLLAEALAAHADVRAVLCAGEAPALPEGVRVYPVKEELLGYVSPMKSAPELLFSCGIPAEPPLHRGRLLLLEDMQDPGNVGTMLRSAAALGFDGALLAGDCADPWGPKAVRASMGAVFRMALWADTTASCLERLRALELPFYAAALGEHSLTAGRFAFPPQLILAIGNEGHGLSAAVLRSAAQVVRIPMAAGAESLNAAAAAAVLMWECRRGEDAP